MVDVGGYRLDAQLTGDGPTVVWVAALGEPGANWQPTIERLTRPTTNLLYDRSGIGSSDPLPDPGRPRPYSHFADELTCLLTVLEVAGPVIMVGHSFGGNIVRVFALHNPARVTGLVLVEPSKPYMVLWDGDDGTRIDGDRSDSTHVDTVRGGAEFFPSMSRFRRSCSAVPPGGGSRRSPPATSTSTGVPPTAN